MYSSISLVNLQRQTIRIKEECHLFSRIGICSNRFTLDSYLVQLFYSFFYTCHSESKMPQTTGFRPIHSLWGIFLCKNLKLCMFIHTKIQFPIISFFSVILSNRLKTELFNIEFSGFLYVGNYNRNVMYGIQFHNSTPSALSHRWKLYLPSNAGNAFRYSEPTLASISSALSGSISAMQQPLKPAPEKRPP